MQHKTRTKALGVLLSLVLALGLLPAMAQTARAAASVSYIDGSGMEQSCETYTVVTDSTTTWNAGWYVVNSNVAITGRITCSGDVNLILCDNASLTVTDSDTGNGGAIQWGDNTGNFTIYAQSTGNDMGSLTAIHSDASYGYGICVNQSSLTINGGNVTAQGGYDGIWVKNDITINGGIVNADTNSSLYGSILSLQGNIAIHGGTVNATGGKYGIDTYGNSNYVLIAGGTVTASGNTSAFRYNVKNTIAGTGWTDKAGTQGEAAIATSDEGQSLSSYKKVQFTAPAPVTGVTLSPTTLALTVGGETPTLTATVSPDGATDKTVTWASSDETVATVSDGVVTPVAAGTATITVTTTDGGFTDTCAVTVDKASISLSVSMVNWTYGEKENDPSVSGNTGNGAVTYDYKVSTADEDAYTATKPGVAGTYTVRATVAETANYYGGTATADFTIAPRAEEEAPKFTSHRMVLTSEIGLQFRVAFPDSFDAEGCYVNFVVSDGRNFDVQYEDAQSVPGSATDKYFNCPLNALELADTVTATLHYGAGQEKTNTYSAMTYFNAARGLERVKLTSLVNSLQDLGHYIGAAEWTDNNTPHAAIAAMSTPSVDTATAGVSEKDVTCDNGNLAEVKVSLTLAENTVINLYVKPAAGVTITNYKGTKTIDEETYYLIQSDKFGPKLLGTDQNIIVETSAGETTVSVSAMAYVNKGLSAESTMTPAQKTALAAFYNYFVAAYAYE